MPTQGAPEENSLEAFVTRLTQEKGLQNLDAEVLKQVKSDIMSRLEDRINVALVAALPPDKVEGIEKLVDKGNSAQIQKYFAENIPNLSELVAAELVAFRQTYLS